jgi:hypothetical protein
MAVWCECYEEKTPARMLALRRTSNLAKLGRSMLRPYKWTEARFCAVDLSDGNTYASRQREGRIQSAERAVPTFRRISNFCELLSA